MTKKCNIVLKKACTLLFIRTSVLFGKNCNSKPFGQQFFYFNVFFYLICRIQILLPLMKSTQYYLDDQAETDGNGQ